MTALAGAGRTFRLAVRNERVSGPAWFGSVSLVLAGIAVGIVSTYPTPESRGELAGSVAASVGERFLIGRVDGTDAGSLALWRIQGSVVVLIGLAAVLMVVRNTRAPEEDGVVELLAGARIGRAAPLAAALAVAALGSLSAGGMVAAAFVAIGAVPLGAVLVGAQVVLVGLVTAAVAGVAGQIVRTTRTATAIGIAVVAACYLLRGASDVIGGAAYWMSPFGWIAAVRPFAGGSRWMLLPPLVLAVALTTAALAIASRRDLGAGMLPDRAGPARAREWLRGPVSLLVRTARSSMIGWGVGALLIGLLIGGIASTVDQQVSLPVGGVTNGRGLAPVAIYLVAVLAAVNGILGVSRLRGDETSGRADQILARPISRAHWLAAYLVTGALGSLATTVAMGLGVGLATPGQLAAYLAAGALRAVAAWVFVALAALLAAALHRAGTLLSFAALTAYLVLELLVEFGLAPAAALVVSPFALAPQLPDGPANSLTSLALLGITAALVTGAVRLVRRRDIH